MTTENGPHLNACVFCEKVIEDKEGVLSLIRVIDRITQSATGSDVPDDMPPFMLQGLFLVITLKADQARGRYGLKIVPEDPSGRSLPAMEVPVQLTPGPGGVNLVSEISIPIELEGVYWFDVIFVAKKDIERRLTRVPLEIIYAPQKIAPS